MTRFHTADLAGRVARAKLHFRHTEVRAWPMAKTRTKAPKEPAPKMGRPPARGEASSVLAIRLTNTERADYESAAAAASMSLSEWIRAACAKALKRQKG